MATYNLTVNIEQESLRILAAGNYSLCFATSIEDPSGADNFNVVALAVPTLTPSNRISWTRTYAMAATTQTFQSGTVVAQGQSARLPINNGQAYNLEAWSEPPTVVTSSIAPANGFALSNKVFAAALIYLNVSGAGADPVPIYISNVVVPGVAKFIPVVKIAVWFQQNIRTSTMIVVDTSFVHIMDFTSTTNQTTTYTNQGTWRDGNGLVSRAIDYTKVIPAYTGEHGKRREEQVEECTGAAGYE